MQSLIEIILIEAVLNVLCIYAGYWFGKRSVGKDD